MNLGTEKIITILASEMKAKPVQVIEAIRLLDEGATVPFIARYRKDITQGLSDSQLRILQDRLSYLRDLEDRRGVILKSLTEQKVLTEALELALQQADTKTRLEDIYLPYRPKRKTKAQAAIEAGLKPLALLILDHQQLDDAWLSQSVNPEKGINNEEAVLSGVKHILMELFSEEHELVHELREYVWQHGRLEAKNTGKVKKEQASKFADYFQYQEAIKKIPSHRALALFRGRKESVLQLTLKLTEEQESYLLHKIAQFFKLDDIKPAFTWLWELVKQTWQTKLFTKLEVELFARLREAGEEEAIKVFSRNLRGLLLSSPLGQHVTMGLDPGIRTGVKVAVVDNTGKFLEDTVVFPLPPQNEWHQSIAALAKLIVKHKVEFLSIGNGTGSRETERLVMELMKMYPDLGLKKVTVSEAGASVYSASALAEEELPTLDVSLRGAVSIARRLQDPLAELVKITPKSIGVGLYQHDVNQQRLAQCLEGVVEDCVNYVGVDLNTASPSLLSFVSGLNSLLAKNIIEYRDTHGPFSNREQLLNVPRMGEKSYQQASGFLRIQNGDNPLDNSGIHPEAYPLVKKILTTSQLQLSDVLGKPELLKNITVETILDDHYGRETVIDVLKELEKPGRDPRPQFKTVQFKEGIESIQDLTIGLQLEGVVSNVTNFGAFVDIGVHQDGLIHISAMSNKFVNSPNQLLKAGDIVKVEVVEVDKVRKRIGLSLRVKPQTGEPVMNTPKSTHPSKLVDTTQKNYVRPKVEGQSPRQPSRQPQKNTSQAVQKKFVPAVKKSAPAKLFNTAMADAFAKLKGDKV